MNQGMNAWIDHLNACLFLLGSGRVHSDTPWKGCFIHLRQKEEEQVRRGNMCCLGCLHHHDQPCSVGVCVYLHTRVESYHHPHIMRFERPSRLLSFLTCYIASST